MRLSLAVYVIFTTHLQGRPHMLRGESPAIPYKYTQIFAFMLLVRCIYRVASCKIMFPKNQSFSSSSMTTLSSFIAST